MIFIAVFFQTTGLLLSALGKISAMTDLGDSKDDAQSLLDQLKEFTDKSVVSTHPLEHFVNIYISSFPDFLTFAEVGGLVRVFI